MSALAIQRGNAAAFNAYSRPGMQEGGFNLKKGLKSTRKIAGVASKIGKVAGTGIKVAGVVTGQPELVAAGQSVKMGSKAVGKTSKGLKQAGFGRVPPRKATKPLPRPIPGRMTIRR